LDSSLFLTGGSGSGRSVISCFRRVQKANWQKDRKPGVPLSERSNEVWLGPLPIKNTLAFYERVEGQDLEGGKVCLPEDHTLLGVSSQIRKESRM